MRARGPRTKGLTARMPVHPTAIVDASAKIADSAILGPYCVIGADVEIGARTELKSHICVEGPIQIGEDNYFFPFSNIALRTLEDVMNYTAEL